MNFRRSSTSDGPLDAPVIARWAIAVYAALSLVYFAPAFFPDRQIAGTDYFTGGYYFLEFALRRMGGGSLPKWLPYVFGGLPMYANPGGLFYPIRLLLGAMLPVARVMAAMFVIQFAVAGIGMHLFARALGVRHWVALVAGLAFEFTGVTMSYVYAGHDGRIIAATLTPLAFYFVLRAVESGHFRAYLGLAATLGFAMLSFQLQSVYYLLIGAGAWAVFLLVRSRHVLRRSQLARRAVFGVVSVAFAFALAAVDLLPFSQYIKDSPRAAVAKRDFAFSTQFSMPPVETIGLAVPEQAGILTAYRGANPFKLHTEYVGAFVILMLLIGGVIARRERVWQFMAGLAVFMLTISYGSHTPFYDLYYRFLPGTSKFRSPSISLFLVTFCFVVMAALALERLAVMRDALVRDTPGKHGKDSGPFPLKRLLTAVVALSIAGSVLALGTALDGGARALGWGRFGLCLLVIALLLRAWTRGRITTRVASLALAAATAADLWIIDQRFFWTQPPPEQMFAEDDVVKFLKTQETGRVWVFPFPEEPGGVRYLGNGTFGLHTDYLMRFGIMQAGGEHGNQLYRWNQLAGIAPGGNTIDWHNFVEYPAILDAAGVRYIVSGVRLGLFDTETKTGMTSIREAFRGSAFVYVNDGAISRVALVPAVRTVGTPQEALDLMHTNDWDANTLALVETPTAPFTNPPAAPVAVPAGADSILSRTRLKPGASRISSDDPDRIVVDVVATMPAMLVLSDNYADGWTATIDGRETTILRTNYTFRGVPVTPGPHKIVFEFKPPLLYVGLWISIAAGLLLCVGLVFAIRPPRHITRATEATA
ncbi:MAG: Protein of unknown function, rane YfhO [Gemmatimonadetes bacterium]|nr:Protein of unknown function, rane YfhO [Gemmatimonadota bacterium]